MHQRPCSLQVNIVLSPSQGNVESLGVPRVYELSLWKFAKFSIDIIFPSRPQPPIEVVEHFVDVYRTTMHLQPLPLFRLEGLADQLLAGPQFVLWSFLSLMLTISSHDFFQGQEDIAEGFYARSSEDTTTRLSSCGKFGVEVTQSLCLIALKHIKCNVTTPSSSLCLPSYRMADDSISVPTGSGVDDNWHCLTALRHAYSIQ